MFNLFWRFIQHPTKGKSSVEKATEEGERGKESNKN
jgi:hypothetical protein